MASLVPSRDQLGKRKFTSDESNHVDIDSAASWLRGDLARGVLMPSETLPFSSYGPEEGPSDLESAIAMVKAETEGADDPHIPRLLELLSAASSADAAFTKRYTSGMSLRRCSWCAAAPRPDSRFFMAVFTLCKNCH